MRKLNILLLSLSLILAVSCENSSDAPALTGGVWNLDKGILTAPSETAVFNTDSSYLIESVISGIRPAFPVKGSISGKWIQGGDSVFFLSSFVNLPDDSLTVNVIPSATGVPAGAFYGYIVSGVLRTDSSLINSSGNLHFGDLSGREIFSPDAAGTRNWKILKLSKDSLVVMTGLQTLRYFRTQD